MFKCCSNSSETQPLATSPSAGSTKCCAPSAKILNRIANRPGGALLLTGTGTALLGGILFVVEHYIPGYPEALKLGYGTFITGAAQGIIGVIRLACYVKSTHESTSSTSVTV